MSKITLSCSSCGGSFDIPARDRSGECVYCGVSYTIKNDDNGNLDDRYKDSSDQSNLIDKAADLFDRMDDPAFTASANEFKQGILKAGRYLGIAFGVLIAVIFVGSLLPDSASDDDAAPAEASAAAPADASAAAPADAAEASLTDPVEANFQSEAFSSDISTPSAGADDANSGSRQDQPPPNGLPEYYVDINNSTNSEIIEAYISPRSASDWEENVLGAAKIAVGQIRRITVKGYAEPIFDIRLVDSSGGIHTFREINISTSDIMATSETRD